jgi:hypothetical protein
LTGTNANGFSAFTMVENTFIGLRKVLVRNSGAFSVCPLKNKHG